jgi:Integrase zinc binding domain
MLEQAVTRSLMKGLEDWNYEDGIILFCGHVYVPKDPSLQQVIVKSNHDYVAIGHPGHWKTYELVSQEYWWPGMSTFVCKYVDGCAICQSTKN